MRSESYREEGEEGEDVTAWSDDGSILRWRTHQNGELSFRRISAHFSFLNHA